VTRLALVISALIPLAAVILFGTVERSSAPFRGTEPLGPIYGEHAVSQMFYPDGAVISGVDVRIATYARKNLEGILTLRVRQTSAGPDLRTATVEAGQIQDSALHRFRFVPLATPRRPVSGLPGVEVLPLQFTVESTATHVENAVAVWAHKGPDVQTDPPYFQTDRLASYDGLRQGMDLVFAPIYVIPAPWALGAAIERLILDGFGPWLALLALVLPGALVARLCLGNWAGTVVVMALAPAFGVALIALVTLWTGVLGIRTSPVLPLIITVAAAICLVAIEVARHRDSHPAVSATSRAERWAGAAALGAVALGLGFRAVALDGMATPPGADSYHHTLITQLIMDRGGVPSTYLPYAPISSFSYHFGFHATAAWVGAVIGWDALRGVAMVGLLLNGLAALSVFGLAMLAGLGPVTAGVASVVVAVASPFPMWFLDVGRYPQEAALIVFPIAAAFALGYADRQVCKIGAPHHHSPPSHDAVRPADSALGGRPDGVGMQGGRGLVDFAPHPNPKGQLGVLFGGAVLAAGLFLAHYRIALMLLLLMALHLIWTAIRGRREGYGRLRWNALRCAAILLGAGVLVAPWIVRLLQGFTLGIRGSEGRYAADYYNLERLGTALGHPALGPLAITAAVGVALAVAFRAPLLGLLAAWGAILFLGSNPHWIRVPGAGALDSVTVVSSLYIVGALATGYVAQRVWGVGERLRQYVSGARPHPNPLPEGEGTLAIVPPSGREAAAGREADVQVASPSGRGRRSAARPGEGATTTAASTARPGEGVARALLASTFVRSGLLAALGLLAGWGALLLPGLVQPEQTLADAADLRAAEWIAWQLPADARFLVNASIVGWEPDFVAPTDGGAWLPLLARRETTLLPLVYAGERGVAPAAVDRMEQIARAARADPTSPGTLRLLRESGVTHVYLGARGGPVEEHKLLASPAYRRVYASLGVSIYELVEGR
jgi:hypothetical protein